MSGKTPRNMIRITSVIHPGRSSCRVSAVRQHRQPVIFLAGIARVRALHEGRTVVDTGLSQRDHVVQVYGANTEVGKTIISAGLLRAAALQGFRASYIKPIQAGSPSDAGFISRHAPATTRSTTLFSYTSPVSPHLAAARDGITTSDSEIVDAVVDEIKMALGRADSRGGLGDGGSGTGGEPAADRDAEESLVLVESAGGVLSPAPSGSLQADAFRAMRLPVVLVGDGRLGGIGVTLSALESLRMRGYTVLAIALIAQEEDLGNAQAVRRHARQIPVYELPRLPPSDKPLYAWYAASTKDFKILLEGLAERRRKEVKDALGMKERGKKAIWWPFTQHDEVADAEITVLDSAYGDYFCCTEVEGGGGANPRVSHRSLMDACASWWTHGAGHGNPGMALAIAEAAGRYGHVIFPRNIHAPALKVAERLVAGPGRGWASRVFYSDNGSTATEVGIKMGFRRFLKDRFNSSEPPVGTQVAIVGQNGCYHGDTLGAMNVAVPSIFNKGQHAWYQSKGLFFVSPSVSWRDGRFTVEIPKDMACTSTGGSVSESDLALNSRDEAFDFKTRDGGRLAMLYREHVRLQMDEFENDGETVLGSLLLEPLVMGAGGMVFVDPLFQRVLVQECRARGLPIIYDEVFCGLWRLGVESTRELLGVDPDVSCYAKLLTGGLVPMSATIATERVFDAFSGAKADCLLHGHSYTAHPVGCAAVLEFLSQLEKSDAYPGVGGRMANVWNEDDVARLSRLPTVDRAFSLGTVLAVEMKAADRGYGSTEAIDVVRGLHGSGGLYARVLGNVAYIMVSPTTPAEVCRTLMAIMEGAICGGAEKGDEETPEAAHEDSA